MPRITFNPTPDQLSSLTADLASAELSLRDIADRHNTTLDALTLYLASDAGLAHLATLELVAAERTRVAATCNLNRAVVTLTELLSDYSRLRAADNSRPASPPGAAPHSRESQSSTSASTADAPTAPADPSLAERQRERARRAAYLLFRLATFTPRPLAGLRAPARATQPIAAPTSSTPDGNGQRQTRTIQSNTPAIPPAAPSFSQPHATELPGSAGNSVPAPESNGHSLSSTSAPRRTQGALCSAPSLTSVSFSTNGPRRSARDLVATAGRAP